MGALCYLCFVFVCFLQPCGHLLGRAGLFYVSFLVFLSLIQMVIWVMCGTCFYGFLIFANYLTLNFLTFIFFLT